MLICLFCTSTPILWVIWQVCYCCISNVLPNLWNNYVMLINTFCWVTQPRNATDLLQVVDFNGLLQVAASCLTSSSCSKSVKIRLVATTQTEKFCLWRKLISCAKIFVIEKICAKFRLVEKLRRNCAKSAQITRKPRLTCQLCSIVCRLFCNIVINACFINIHD